MDEDNKTVIFKRLNSARNQMEARIVSAMQRDEKGWFDLCERLHRGDELLENVENLWSKDSPPLDAGQSMAVGKAPVDQSPEEGHESAKSRGERARSDWVNAICSKTGKSLPRLRGALFRNSRNETLGIAYSRENALRPGHWFLGLPGNKYQCAVLLCETNIGDVKAICLSKAFLAKYATAFSTSKAWNQTKFNVVARVNRLYLALISEEIDVTDHIDEYDNVL
jgi:hypothetical protein